MNILKLSKESVNYLFKPQLDILNSEQRIYLQTEANQLLDEMDRVARDTTFNEIAVLDGTFADRRFQIGSHEREKAVISVANLRIQNLGAYQSETDVLEASGSANSLAAEGTTGATAAGINSLIDADDDLTITGLVGTSTVDVADNNTAKTVAELVNAKFDSTGVSATATTIVKLEMLSSDAAGDHVVGFNFMEKSTAQAISATVTLGSTAATSDLTNLRMQLILILQLLE